MRRWIRWLGGGLLFAAALGLIALTAAMRQAKLLERLGDRALQRGDRQEAMTLYQEAYELHEHDRILEKLTRLQSSHNDAPEHGTLDESPSPPVR